MRALAAQGLLPGEGHNIELRPVQVLGEGGAGRVADGDAFAVGGDEVGVRDADARGGAVPGEDQIGVGAHLAEVRQFAVRRIQDFGGKLQLLNDVRHPILAEALEGEKLHGLGAEHRPQGHFDGAGVGTGHDADQEIVGNLQHLAGAVDRLLQAGLARLRTVRAAEDRVLEILGIPSGALCARAGRKLRARRTHCRLGEGRHVDVSHPYR